MAKNHKHTFSKRIVNFALVIFAIVNLCAIVGAFVNRDNSPFAYAIPAAGTLVATAFGFYFNKAKAENSAGGITYDTAMKDFPNPEDSGGE